MSNDYRNGAFALGLVTGGGIALNLFLWLDYRAKQTADQYTEGQNNSENSQVGQLWDGFIGTFVSPNDTLAQWIMAAFTIAATVVLVLTLRSANRTNQAAIEASSAALEANQIMRNEQRPWITIDEVDLVFDLTDIKADPQDGTVSAPLTVKFELRNSGKTPANHVMVWPEIVTEFLPPDSALNAHSTIDTFLAEMSIANFGTRQRYSVAPDAVKKVIDCPFFTYFRMSRDDKWRGPECLIIFIRYTDNAGPKPETRTTWTSYEISITGGYPDRHHGMPFNVYDVKKAGGLKLTYLRGDMN